MTARRLTNLKVGYTLLVTAARSATRMRRLEDFCQDLVCWHAVDSSSVVPTKA